VLKKSANTVQKNSALALSRHGVLAQKKGKHKRNLKALNATDLRKLGHICLVARFFLDLRHSSKFFLVTCIIGLKVRGKSQV
jgi:hypothetical protein